MKEKHENSKPTEISNMSAKKYESIEDVIKLLETYERHFDVCFGTIRFYAGDGMFDTIRVTPHGDTEISGRIQDLDEWLGRVQF